MFWSSFHDHSVFLKDAIAVCDFFYAQFLICVMDPPKSGGSLINEVYDVVFCFGVNLSGDDHIVGTVLWLRQFYDMFERLGLHSNSVSACLHVPIPSVLCSSE